MPITPSAAGRPSSRGGRKSSTRSATDEPSTSAEQTAEEQMDTDESQTINNKRNEIRAVIIGRLFAIMREQRDKTERYLSGPDRVKDAAEIEEKEERLAPLNEHILKLEQNACGMTLEEMLKDPTYANYSDMQPSVEDALDMDCTNGATTSKTMEPIEVKIEDNDNSATTANTVLPSSSQETNMERAVKRENHVMARIAELRKSGLWSNSRLPKCIEPRRNKTHWDYLLEEVVWMATDFHHETKKKKVWAKKLAASAAKLQHDKEVEIEKAQERALRDKKKLCANVAKMVRDFWQGVDKVVDLRSKEILEARVRKARNEHLMFVIGQVNEMSNIVQEGLVTSKSPSIASHDDDKEFSGGEESESDDERTIATAEKSLKKEDVKDEIDALNTEANAEMDDFLASLPPEYLAAYGLTPEDLEEMKKMKRDEVENEPMEVDESKDDGAEDINQPSTSTDSKAKAVKEVEKSQDQTAEDGNGDGRGVLENVDYLKLNSVNSDERQKELANIAEEALKFQPKGYTLETTQVKTPVPFLIRGTMREYQMVGLDWMVTLYEKNLNGILADEMGLGKTIQTISLLAHLACSESIWGPHLIVVPTSVILNWEMEFKKWCPALKILTYFGSAKDRAEKRKGWTKPNTFHVCITSYKTVTQDIRSFKQRAWQYLILDEAQNIKNWKSQRWQALLNVRARRRLLLTGTPLQNSLMELWSLMHFLMPTIFSSHDDFKDWFSNPLTGMMEGNMEFNAPLVQRLHKVLRPFILRRLKKEVEKQLPEKTEHVVKCSLSKRQRYLYDDFMSRRSTKDNLKSGNMMSVLNIVMQLRKCCNHPNLFEPRPVVAPFVIKKQQVDLPAKIFEIADQEPDAAQIPEIFNLADRIGAWQTTVSSRKPLIEEIEAMGDVVDDTSLRPPKVEGFRFNRNNFVNKPSRDLATLPVQNTNGSGEESKSNGHSHPAVVNPSTSSGSMAMIPPSVAPMMVIRTKTVLNTAPLTITTERSGFHYSMANSGQRSYLDQKAQYSPPLKKPKLTGTAIDFSGYVPAHVLEKMEDAHRCQLEVIRRRFGKVRTPIIANEVMNLFIDEITQRMPKMSRFGDEKLRERLGEYVGLVAERFGMYIEPVLSDAWQCRPSSSGLPSYVRNNLAAIENESREFLLETSSNFDQLVSVSRTLQFPELRLIEYDCGKLQTLAILLRQLYVHKHRCLIFTQMSKMLDVLQTFLSHHGYQYFRLDGTTGIEQRQAMMERFNADSKVFCFILSTRSGGVGVNLTGADTVIFYDSDWNPTMDAQAQDRCHRIGQTRNVSIYRLISERTIEENILRKATQKRRLGELAIDDAGFTPDFFKQSDNIRDLFDGEDVDVSAPTDVPSNEKELETVMAKCEDEVDVNAAKMVQAESKVDSAEFDENTKVPTASGDDDADEKYMELINQLKPIERYAISFLEEEYKPEFEEEVKEAEAMIEQKREEWDQKMSEKSESQENNADMRPFDDDDLMDNDLYLGGNFLDEVRDRRRRANNQKSVVPNNLKLKSSARLSAASLLKNIRIRSPSRRKSIAPSLSPYVSSAHLTNSSPPVTPVKKTTVRRKPTVVEEKKKRTKKKPTVEQKDKDSEEVVGRRKVKFEELPELPMVVKKKVKIVEPPKDVNFDEPSTSTFVTPAAPRAPSAPSSSSSSSTLATSRLPSSSYSTVPAIRQPQLPHHHHPQRQQPQQQPARTPPAFNRSQTLLPVKVFVSPPKLGPRVRKVALVPGNQAGGQPIRMVRPLPPSQAAPSQHRPGQLSVPMSSATSASTSPSSSSSSSTTLASTSRPSDAPQIPRNGGPATFQRRLVVVPGSIQRVRHPAPNPVAARTLPTGGGNAAQSYMYPVRVFTRPSQPAGITPQLQQGNSMTPQMHDRPNFGIYERPRLSYRARSESDTSRTQEQPVQQPKPK